MTDIDFKLTYTFYKIVHIYVHIYVYISSEINLGYDDECAN